MNKLPLKFTDRPSYELPKLLKALDAETSRNDDMTEDQRDQAEDIETHAINLLDVIGDGIEAIGKALFSCGANTEWPLDARAISSIGALIQHLAVEQQYLRYVESDMHTRIQMHDQKFKKGGAK